jgi:hypothetical protein
MGKLIKYIFTPLRLYFINIYIISHMFKNKIFKTLYHFINFYKSLVKINLLLKLITNTN